MASAISRVSRRLLDPTSEEGNTAIRLIFALLHSQALRAYLECDNVLYHAYNVTLIRESEEHQACRVEHDPWHSLVADYCTHVTDTSIEELLSGQQIDGKFCGIGKARDQWTQHDRNRVGRCLKILKWSRYRETGGLRNWRYRATY